MQKISKVQNIREIKKQVYESYSVQINIQDMIHKVQRAKVKNGSQKIDLTQKQFIQIVRQAKKLFFNQPCLLKLSSPIRIATGTLGNYKQLSSIFSNFGNPRFINYIFIGDYAGRYSQSIQCIAALCLYKVLMPYNFFMLRGCHQCIAMAKSYDLYKQLCQRYSSKAWLQVCQLYCNLPYAAVIDQKIFTVHGGISPKMKNIQQINKIKKPGDTPDRDIGCDLIWSDYNPNISEWAQNQRGISFCFGNDILSQFLSLNEFMMLCRGHEVVSNGYMLSPTRKLVTICSLSNYLGFYRNHSAIMNIDDQNNLYFSLLKQKKNQETEQKQKEKIIRMGDFVFQT